MTGAIKANIQMFLPLAEANEALLAPKQDVVRGAGV